LRFRHQTNKSRIRFFVNPGTRFFVFVVNPVLDFSVFFGFVVNPVLDSCLFSGFVVNPLLDSCLFFVFIVNPVLDSSSFACVRTCSIVRSGRG
jgi:hypothetical protein